ncbi:MAG: hypothetical protein JSU77_13725 [Fidelibacterota bacterium]|nr:MAG: hypothetical protein JSU77_13725 [Candidatus Neomarinimicrobiota bacterium]
MGRICQRFQERQAGGQVILTDGNGVGTYAIKTLNQGTGLDLRSSQGLSLQPGLGEKEVSPINYQDGMWFRYQAFDDSSFPGQTAQTSALSPAGLDLAQHVPRSHDFNNGSF